MGQYILGIYNVVCNAIAYVYQYGDKVISLVEPWVATEGVEHCSSQASQGRWGRKAAYSARNLSLDFLKGLSEARLHRCGVTAASHLLLSFLGCSVLEVEALAEEVLFLQLYAFPLKSTGLYVAH